MGEESGLSARRRFTLAEAEVRAAFGTAEAVRARAEALARAWRADLEPAAIPASVAPPEPPATTDPADSPELPALTFEAEQAALEQKRAGRFLCSGPELGCGPPLCDLPRGLLPGEPAGLTAAAGRVHKFN